MNDLNSKSICNICQEESDHCNTKRNCRFNVDVLNVNFSVSHNSVCNFKRYPVSKASIPSGTINATPNQPADRFTKRSEIIENKFGSILTGGTLQALFLIWLQ